MLSKLIQVHDNLPGRTFRRKTFERIIPPLWVWLRSVFFISVGVGLYYLGVPTVAKVLITLAVVQLVAISLSVVFQELANALKRFFKMGKPNNSDDGDI